MAIALLQTESILEPVSADAPCGDDLEYDAEFLALARAADPPGRSRLVGPDAPVEEPPWANILKQAVALYARTKDLRVTVILIRAASHTHSVAGLAGSTAILRALLERYWPQLHPALDDDGDPTTRINTLRSLCDRETMLLFLRNLPLVSVPALGSFALKDLAAAAGDATIGAGGTTDISKLDAAFSNCDLAVLHATVAELASAIADLRFIESWVTDRVGAYQALSLEELASVLEQMHRLVQARAAARAPVATAGVTDDAESDGTQGAPDGGDVTQAPVRRVVPVGGIASRADVQRTIDLLCAYFEQNEPSSPVPILLKRARRLTTMNFFDIVRDLVPDGTDQLEKIRGPVDE